MAEDKEEEQGRIKENGTKLFVRATYVCGGDLEIPCRVAHRVQVFGKTIHYLFETSSEKGYHCPPCDSRLIGLGRRTEDGQFRGSIPRAICAILTEMNEGGFRDRFIPEVIEMCYVLPEDEEEQGGGESEDGRR